MFLVTNFLRAMARVLDIVSTLYLLILLGRVIVFWFSADTEKPMVRFLYGATEPVLEKVRQRLPFVVTGFDFSPVVVWIAIEFLRRFLVRSLYDLADALM